MDMLDKARQEEIWRRANPSLRPFAAGEAPAAKAEAAASIPPEEALAAELRKRWRLYCGWSGLLRQCPECLRRSVWVHAAALKADVRGLSQSWAELWGKPPALRGGPPPSMGFSASAGALLAEEEAAWGGSPPPDARERMETLRRISGLR